MKKARGLDGYEVIFPKFREETSRMFMQARKETETMNDSDSFICAAMQVFESFFMVPEKCNKQAKKQSHLWVRPETTRRLGNIAEFLDVRPNQALDIVLMFFLSRNGYPVKEKFEEKVEEVEPEVR